VNEARSAALPLGSREDQRLEFKGRESLRELRRLSIAREVVAMLNADGGEVWVGLAEDQGVAVRVEPIARVESEAARLSDDLSDLIEPPLVRGEVRVDVVGSVLRVTAVPRSERRPYGLKGEAGAMYFPVRIGDRIRPMTREEQRKAFARAPEAETDLGRAVESLLGERQELQRGRTESLLLHVRPVPAIALEGRQDDIAEMLRDPERTGNRPSGWSFANPYVEPTRRTDGSVRNAWPPEPVESEDWWSVDVRANGAIVYEAGLERLSAHGARGRTRSDDSPPELWPLALAELPVSVLRLAATLYDGSLRDEDRVLADLSLFGLRGWKLRPGSPRFLGPGVVWDFSEGVVFEERDLLLQQPLVFTWREVRETPDRCGFRLMQALYREFGYGDEALPMDLFDPRSGRFRLTG
jgi:hypothetical protein